MTFGKKPINQDTDPNQDKECWAKISPTEIEQENGADDCKENPKEQ